jgi:glycosyltransferase involved in cell wall biosynthesis
MKIYGLIPAYNEGKNIREVVTRIRKVRITPVVIDDASRDDTFEQAKKTGSVVLRHKKNRGKAEAIKTGLQFLQRKKFDYVVLIDADLQYLPEEAPKLIRPLKSGMADFVAGFRNFSRVPFVRHRLGNFVWKTSFNILFGTKFKDTNCGFVAMNRKAAQIIMDKLQGGYILENSMFIQVIKNRMKATQVPVTVKYHRSSAVSRGIRVVAGVTFYILREGIKHRLRIA